MILVSACLAGEKCRYDGKCNTIESIKEMVEKGEAIPICPEVLGGLSTPRVKSECISTSPYCVKNELGEDVTKEFMRGAKAAYNIGRVRGADHAILKSKSPSCGCEKIYDGQFAGKLIDGEGVTANYLRGKGYTVINEKDFEEGGF